MFLQWVANSVYFDIDREKKLLLIAISNGVSNEEPQKWGPLGGTRLCLPTKIIGLCNCQCWIIYEATCQELNRNRAKIRYLLKITIYSPSWLSNRRFWLQTIRVNIQIHLTYPLNELFVVLLLICLSLWSSQYERLPILLWNYQTLSRGWAIHIGHPCADVPK